MTNTSPLKSQTKDELVKLAKKLGIETSSSMRKTDLEAAILEHSEQPAPSPSKASPKMAPNASRKKSAKPREAIKKSTTKLTAKPKSSDAGNSAKANGPTSMRRQKSETPKSKDTAEGTNHGRPARAKRSKSPSSESSGGAAKSKSEKIATSKTAVSKKSSKRPAASEIAASEIAAKPKASKPQSLKPQSPKAKPTVAKANAAKTKVAAKEPKPAAASRTKQPGNDVGAGAEKVTAKKAVEKKPVKKAKQKPSTTNPQVLKKIRELQLQKESNKDIGFKPALVRPPGATEPIWEKEPQKDRIGLFVRDAFWLQVTWDITRHAIERVKAAMAEQWHGAKPILRLLRLEDTGTSSASETVERDIEIHGGLKNWYIPWTGESATFRVMVGYLAAQDRFHAIAESNIVKTPYAETAEAADQHWTDASPEGEKLFALSGGYDSERETGELKEILEDRIHRQLGTPTLARLGASASGHLKRRNDFHFDMEIELVVYGSTVPDGYLTMNGEPVSLRQDGTFAVRLPFPDRRQVLPAVAVSRDGSQQRTIVVAVERNTKIMEPLEQERDTGE